MKIPEGWKLVPINPTPEDADARKDVRYTEDEYIRGIDAAFARGKQAAPTPPEVEPVHREWNHLGTTRGTRKELEEDAAKLREWVKKEAAIFASLSSPKAEWDAEGNPLNLEAAARDAVRMLNIHCGECSSKNLRKFLKDQS